MSRSSPACICEHPLQMADERQQGGDALGRFAVDRVVKEDGRYLLYYSWPEPPPTDAGGAPADTAGADGEAAGDRADTSGTDV